MSDPAGTKPTLSLRARFHTVALQLRWSDAALTIGLVAVAVHVAIRLTSGIGWFFLEQLLSITPWLSLLLLPFVLSLTRRLAEHSRKFRAVLLLTVGLVLISAVVVDTGDTWGECFLTACLDHGNGTEPWWWTHDWVWSMDDVSIQLSRLAVAVEVGALCWWGLHDDSSEESATRRQALRARLR